MKAKLHYVLATTIFLITFSLFGQNNLFTKVEKNSTLKSKTKIRALEKGITFEFDYKTLSNALSNTSNKSSSGKSTNIIISLPNINGESERFKIEESSVMHPDLQTKYPEIKSYIGYGIDSPSAYLRFSLSPYKGLSGIILGKKETQIFEPNSKKTNQFTVLNKSESAKTDRFNCSTINSNLKTLSKSLGTKDADDSLKRTYKLALSVTGEYAAYHGGTLALVNAALVSTLTNINAVFENDFNVS